MTTTPALELLHPLPLFCEAAGRELPVFDLVEPGTLPAPVQRLLVHAGDMTSKLEEFFAGEIRLRVLRCDHDQDHYRREVILYSAATGLPVEYGAIEIELAAFDGPLRDEIVEGRVPLGGLLNHHGIRYRSQPRAFLRVAPDMHLAQLFNLPAPVTLYGRVNQLLDASDRILARIVELLRPV